MNIRLSDHFTCRRLLRFTLPSIVMMIFTSIYGVVDGFFVSNFVGKTPFAAINLIMPFLMAFGALGFMIGTGGSALVAKTLGEGKQEKANALFSMLIVVTLAMGALVAAAGMPLLRPAARALGAQGAMLEDCVRYGGILLPATGAFMLQNVFQSFFITAERPRLGLMVTVAAGVTNMALDALFIMGFGWGLEGAAAATAISQLVGGGIPLVYFLSPNQSLLRLSRPAWDLRALGKACTNGSSEMMTNLSLSLVNMLYNFQLIRLAGEDGVAAYGVIMYVNLIFLGVFIGYSIGSAPVVSYHFGADNRAELRGLLRRSLGIIAALSVAMTVLAEALALPLARIFVGYDAALLEMTRHGFMLYSLSFLFAGGGIFGSAFFTALNNGAVSALISFLRALVFQVAAVLVLPRLMGLDGVWLAVPAAEALALAVAAACFAAKRKRYGY